MRSASSLLENANSSQDCLSLGNRAVSIFLSSLISHLMALGSGAGRGGVWGGGISGMAFLLPFYMLLLGCSRSASAGSLPACRYTFATPLRC